MLKETQDTNITTTIENFTTTAINTNFTEAKDAVGTHTAKPLQVLQQMSSRFFNEMRDDQNMNGQAGQKNRRVVIKAYFR